MIEQPHQSVADAISDPAQLGGEQNENEAADVPMNDDDEVVEPRTGDAVPGA